MADDKQDQDEEEELVPSPGRPRFGKKPRKKKVAKKSAPKRQKKTAKKKSRAR